MYGLLKKTLQEQSDTSSEKSHRMQIVLPLEAAKNLETLRVSTESPSFGELIRKAVYLLHRVHETVGVPYLVEFETMDKSETEGEEEEGVIATHRLQAIVTDRTIRRIEKLLKAVANEKSAPQLKTKSDVVRFALDLYDEVSDAQDKMMNVVIRGPKGEMLSSLAFAP